ncbi:putative methyltransferase domain-containing protein [Diplodia seriata]|uniref:Putative methyltransferase domain-containing protein n=1 Tax=Diplodia seriata TaxID=420778 RepID=A0A0G2G8L1_9PEZI|nr:putative methyltransferase domain-containing protein [Diplodia seriata]
MAKPTTTTPADHQPDTSAGIAAYSSLFLRYIYDTLVLGLYCTFAWRCRTRPTLVQFFNAHMPTPTAPSPRGARILDIGVGTGYFLAQAPLSASRVTDVVLVDLNANCLAQTAPRVEAAHPSVRRVVRVQADFFSLALPDDVEGAGLNTALISFPVPPLFEVYWFDFVSSAQKI